MTTNTTDFPNGWGDLGASFEPTRHLMQLKGRDYMNVQNRLLWFIRDQRAFTAAGLAKTPYVVQTEQVELDRAKGYACFKTYVRDVLGNEATMYGSEEAKDFGDYAEKASTKSLGRALLALGYGTAFAPEMDEGERVVDAPRERQATAARSANSSNSMNLANDHVAVGTTIQDLKLLAEQYGIVDEKWGALFHKHKGALPAIYADIRATAREIERRQAMPSAG